ncbi:hypothetical protein, partial [Mesorhizobium sp.]|uniref:hypothetical protein n=1 Tax=Mesorhizobium sp. TaxID=1871066 RepID=UPI0025BFC99E
MLFLGRRSLAGRMTVDICQKLKTSYFFAQYSRGIAIMFPASFALLRRKWAKIAESSGALTLA